MNLHPTFRNHIASISLFRRLGPPWHGQLLLQSVSSLGWPRRTYAHEPGATAVAGKFGSAFSAGRLSTDDFGVGRWRTRSNVRAFPRSSMSGSPLRRTGRSGDSRLTPIPDLRCLMAEGHHRSIRLQLLYIKGHSAQSDLF